MKILAMSPKKKKVDAENGTQGSVRRIVKKALMGMAVMLLIV